MPFVAIADNEIEVANVTAQQMNTIRNAIVGEGRKVSKNEFTSVCQTGKER